MSGTLYLVATPIGNLGDMTPRAIDTLRKVDAVYAEDTRVTRRLFTHFDINSPLKRFDEVTGERKIPEILTQLHDGCTIALVSDAGTPAISDPGMPLVAAARSAGIEVIPIPGASAVTAALCASGLPTHAYYFGGFLPRKKGKRENVLGTLDEINATLVFYESPHRVAATMAHLAELYPDRQGAFARELTKKFEELRRDNLPILAAELNERQKTGNIKGEFVILIAPESKKKKD
jgi:16S rRNA (cytidine1402-2'-O)-methyltransferase